MGRTNGQGKSMRDIVADKRISRRTGVQVTMSASSQNWIHICRRPFVAPAGTFRFLKRPPVDAFDESG